MEGNQKKEKQGVRGEMEKEEMEKVILEEKITELEILRQSLKETKDLNKEYYDQLLRLKAEFDNYRKRMEREKIELIKFGHNDLILKLLLILDDFEKAQKSIEKDKDINHIISGMHLIYKNLTAILEKEGLKKQEVIGRMFDPHLHHAVMYVDSDRYKDNEVIEELQKGYFLKDKVVRPAMVKVSRKIKKEESKPPTAEQKEASNDHITN